MNALWKFTTMLVITLAVISIYSFEKKPFKIPFLELRDDTIVRSELEIKQTTIADLFKPDTIIHYALTPIAFDSSKIKQIHVQEEMDTTAQRILLIGDSMLEGLRLRMLDYCKDNNHHFKTVIWYSAQTKWYGESDTLQYFIEQYKPTYIMLVLGANELMVRNIKTKRLRHVKHIISQMDTIPFVWIGPPNWREDTGINELIIENVGSLRYFPSKNLKYQRTKDGAHPTHRSAAVWLDSIATWVMRDSQHPILLKKPTKSYKGSTNTTLLQPL